MYVLGIESSCDETAAAVVTADQATGSRAILANTIYSQTEEHRPFGGVVPEIAARAHLEKIDIVVGKALEDANLDLSQIDVVAATCGPGLIGGVIVGATFAKTISMSTGIPFIAINHIAAHALSIRLTEDVNFPYLLLLASGGHCQLCLVRNVDNFEVIGKTIDDSVGESFDKVAKLLGYGYPGGPIIEKMSEEGDDASFQLPRPLCQRGSCDFSFSGLKTAVRIATEKCRTEQDKINLGASFQRTVTGVLSYKMEQAIIFSRRSGANPTAAVIAGGVAANRPIRIALQSVCDRHELRFCAPPTAICTDNGAMIAWMGVEKARIQQFSNIRFRPRPRWPLDEL
ncbi:MAG: tRNA (adenosine(37)-N6)-threonylcarbamoyltransferase complex transferase subunit TsaD [Holosporaceae bacterium]|nr:tRNA (adenosine(37)-N6)-threonylcarbamoyltransferase complex transferase subunit TsaD [Holosporaceae bacterium]